MVKHNNILPTYRPQPMCKPNMQTLLLEVRLPHQRSGRMVSVLEFWRVFVISNLNLDQTTVLRPRSERPDLQTYLRECIAEVKNNIQSQVFG